MRLLPLLAAAVAIPSLVACIVDSGPRRDSPAPQPTTTATTPTPTQPMVVTVDTNQTMTATGGDGVGVFVEYKAGGHWHVWMTCDTNKSGQDCNFDLKLSPASGSLKNAVPSPGSANVAVTTTGGSVEATTLITTELAGVDFDADPGSRVTIDATVSGLHSGDFFFFVQDGKVNGGYGGKLSNPLTFEPTQP